MSELLERQRWYASHSIELDGSQAVVQLSQAFVNARAAWAALEEPKPNGREHLEGAEVRYEWGPHLAAGGVPQADLVPGLRAGR